MNSSAAANPYLSVSRLFSRKSPFAHNIADTVLLATIRAHLNGGRSGSSTPQNGSPSLAGSGHPLDGLVPRKVTVDQTKKLMDGDVNPFKKGAIKAPFSANYRKILEGRKKLPVFDKMQEFFDVVSKPSAGSRCNLKPDVRIVLSPV
jgi:hypothetical protein